MIRTLAICAICLLATSIPPAGTSSIPKEFGAAILNFASAQKDPSNFKCPREEAARIRLGQYLFFVPRILLVHVENDDGSDNQAWRCSDVEIDARSFFIDVRSNNVGTEFYADWIEARKLPRSIHLAVRGKFKSFLAERFAAHIEKGATIETTEGGMEYIEFPSQTYYSAGSLGMHDFDKQPIIYECSPRIVKGNARVCSTYYHFNETFDLRYRFLDPPFVPED